MAICSHTYYRVFILDVSGMSLARRQNALVLRLLRHKLDNHSALDRRFTGRLSSVQGVSENLILGQLAPVGTGYFQLLLDDSKLDDAIEVGVVGPDDYTYGEPFLSIRAACRTWNDKHSLLKEHLVCTTASAPTLLMFVAARFADLRYTVLRCTVVREEFMQWSLDQCLCAPDVSLYFGQAIMGKEGQCISMAFAPGSSAKMPV